MSEALMEIKATGEDAGGWVGEKLLIIWIGESA
jgi:hypothetical protein